VQLRVREFSYAWVCYLGDKPDFPDRRTGDSRLSGVSQPRKTVTSGPERTETAAQPSSERTSGVAAPRVRRIYA